ncbi:GNAT family N-acetyltransferase [Yoonia sp. 2307UL14-13]|uniref:GNAT family N-acetyltransferase n=1 Tax=Yoonia sp. 2307UL14-13 TaxID=3126506 RepID=UPI0030A1B2C9
MIKADPADQPEITAFLQPHAPFAMFPMSNLADHGMSGGHDYAMTCWVAREAGQITDVMSLCDNGMAMPFLPSGDHTAALAALGDRDVIGMAGPRQQVRGLMALGFAHAKCTFDHDEPQFLLSLKYLIISDGPGDLRPLTDAPTDIITGWIKDYDVNTLNAPEEQATKQAAKTYDRYVATQSHMVLMDGDTPLAMTGFNARLPDIVQLGGIYTPPALRNQGHARRAVALHLAQVAKEGVTRATLFSASEAAAKAYQAVGFRQIGEWSLILFDGPHRVSFT